MRGQSFPRDEEEFSFMKVELEVVRRCPDADICQTFQNVCCNIGGWEKREEKLCVVCIIAD